MSIKEENPQPIQFIRGLCQGKTEEEFLEAEENFREYLLIIKGMSDRIESEEKGDSGFDDLSIV